MIIVKDRRSLCTMITTEYISETQWQMEGTTGSLDRAKRKQKFGVLDFFRRLFFLPSEDVLNIEKLQYCKLNIEKLQILLMSLVLQLKMEQICFSTCH